MAWQLLSALPKASAVVDEPAHLTAGYLAVAQGDLSVNREHPPLMKVLAALPLAALAPLLPPGPSEGFIRTSEDFEFAYSRSFLYGSNDADRLLGVARVPIVLASIACGLVLFLWGRTLLGAAGALAGLALFAFEPNLLAHGRLVTTDMGAALWALAGIACLERALSGPGPAGRLWSAGAGLALGLGLATRFSILLLVPLMALCAAMDGRLPARARVGRLALAFVIALPVTSLVYVAAGGASAGPSLFPLAAPPVGGPLLSEPLASLQAHPAGRWLPLPVPRLWLEGLDLARWKNLHVEGPGYLNGAYSEEGWWSYFVLALGMKTTIPWLLLSAGGLIIAARGALRGGRAERVAAVYLGLPALGFIGLVTATTRAQIGLRYILPAIPFLCLAGAMPVAALVSRARVPGRARLAAWVIVGALLAWHAGEAIRIHPYHLAYFNEAAGGPDGGYRHLVDSNLDWGQDLIGLTEFLSARGVTRVNLYYFGTADPAYYGIERAVPPEPGWYAVSATHLMGVYLPDRDYLAPFRGMRPETAVGHSILVYRLDRVPDFLKVPIGRP